jgi:hypothetical protein
MKIKIFCFMLLLSQYACSQTYTIQFIDQNNKILESITKELYQKSPCVVFSEDEKKCIENLNLHRGYINVIENGNIVRKYRVIGKYDSDIYNYNEDFVLCDGKGRVVLENDAICMPKIVQNSCSQQDTIFLQCNDFKVLVNEKYYLDIEITQDYKIKEIAKIKKPIFCFYIEGQKYIAKGNELLKSSVPENCDYFYPIDEQGNVVLFKGKLSLIKIHSE